MFGSDKTKCLKRTKTPGPLRNILFTTNGKTTDLKYQTCAKLSI